MADWTIEQAMALIIEHLGKMTPYKRKKALKEMYRLAAIARRNAPRSAA
jgi:hypothetical protein